MKLELISEEAAEWFVRIKDGEVGSADMREYVRWLKQSPMHVAESLKQQQNYQKYRNAELAVFERERVGTESNAVELIPLGETEEEEIDSSELVMKNTSPIAWKVAAAVAIVVVLLGVLVRGVWFDPTIETVAGEWRQLVLADGSVVRVGPFTEVSIKFTNQERAVDLQRGEVFFQVAKDRKRPFLVHSGLAAVRAVGTQFAVSRRVGDVIITVSEGTVAVLPWNVPGDESLRADRMVPSPLELTVSADEQVRVSPLSWPKKIEKVDAARELAWARGRLIFNTETIAEAIQEFNRRNRVQIAVVDPTIASMSVCCVFDATDPKSFAEAIAADPHIALIHDPSGVLWLVPEGKTEREETHIQ